jgi:isocitrate dehydrogenase kinase/phosphatase
VRFGSSLVSFDVVSLFTSIDVRLATHEIMEKWLEIEEITPIEKDDFQKLLNICTDAGYFSHEDRIYKQVFGTPMGSPLSPVLADIVMDKVLDHVMERKRESINYICKYVDNILAIVKTSEIQNILDVFHSYNQSLKFTCEIENKGRIPYLEVQIIKTDNGSIDLDWYQKPTSTNRILNYLSNHPNHQKLNTTENLLRRATTLCVPNSSETRT